MLDFIIKYWLEVLFGLICTGSAALVKYFLNKGKKEKEDQEKKLLDTINTKMDEQKRGMKEQMNECYNNLLDVVKASEAKSLAEDEHIHTEIDSIKNGVLSIEGRAFKEDCRKLLEPGHIITLAEYEALQAEHEIYNSLGGNHEGDGLFSMAEAKYRNGLKNAEEVNE